MNKMTSNDIGNLPVDFSVGSMPADYGYDDEGYNNKDDDLEKPHKPRILILGLRR